MADEEWLTAHRPPALPRQPTAGEPLFTFVRASDRAPMSCELRFHGEYGWEAQFLERGELFASGADSRCASSRYGGLRRNAERSSVRFRC
jgi:hypothetical protein